jgi:hypothetical protein
MFLTESDILKDLHSVVSYKDQALLVAEDGSIESVFIDMELGRFVRNKYKLWNKENPLTKNWFDNPETHDMREGIDYSLDHPDNLSGKIIKKFKSEIKNQ